MKEKRGREKEGNMKVERVVGEWQWQCEDGKRKFT